ncbi:serine/threonine-protein kinase [Phytoactinopolyspora endophytica]|uniref:serine/threonine-protein kinase n=1 Tax=Phytoactinopolyspora endophytica TaxID=1642495 RepID=UPI00101BB970|nr:serine/threonine-protein kinase [Phytoactinopolyspora endophytica]
MALYGEGRGAEGESMAGTSRHDDGGTASEMWAPHSQSSTGDPGTGTTPGGFHLDGYHGFTEVARGGDSIVYRARQGGLDRDVAIKAVTIDDPATRDRFARELDITVRLGRQHPHIITVLDTGTSADGHACIVMDFFDLGSLHDRLAAHGPLSADEVAAAGTVVADALDFAHGHGVLHRDIKPQNILVLPTSYVLTDFGIARMADAGHTASLERFSYRHASPQVLDGESPTVADDLWSLGSTLFTLLDGRPPFAVDDPDEDTALAYLRRVRTGQIRELHRSDAPTELIRIVERCLSARREDRFADAATVRAALSGVRTEHRSWAPGSDGGDSDPADDDLWGPGSVVPSLPPPQPAAPGPVAPSALAHISDPGVAALAGGSVRAAARSPASGADLDAPGLHAPGLHAPDLDTPDLDATGLRPAEPAQDADDEPSTDQREPGTRPGRWMVMAAFLGGALLLGTLGGALIAVLGSNDEADSPERPASSSDGGDLIPDDPDIDPAADPLDPDLSDAEIAPGDVQLRDDGTSIRVSWTDPTDGNSIFIVVDVTDDAAAPDAVAQVDQGMENVTVPGVDSRLDEVCYQVVGILANEPDRFGASERQCVTR